MSFESSVAKSPEERATWMKKVLCVQMKRTPEAWEAARVRIESSRQHEVSYRKCKAAKSHSVRSRALAAEGLRQMSMTESPEDYQAVQSRWQSAQAVSKSMQVSSMQRADMAFESSEVADVLNHAGAEEEAEMQEVANLVGSTDAHAMLAIGAQGVEEFNARTGMRASLGGGGGSTSVEALLQQLRVEPSDEAECAAKFLLYEGYGSEVEQMRTTLLKFHEESRPTVPAPVAAGMDAEIKRIDSTEAMGIPDDARGWFVYHMMRQAEKNNLQMARILDNFEKKLEFLTANDQSECPVCMESFGEEGVHVPETLSCCHKVCKECWDNWTAVCYGKPFCPLCRHEDFLGRVASSEVTDP